MKKYKVLHLSIDIFNVNVKGKKCHYDKYYNVNDVESA